ncbi:divalent-cation tolerance protein CutA [Mangrovicella endophytica]|uniref:divalent-cation tolerance protein CutA n=1 Tax=Mangrovicella endophytica TaxID=2066697 RepID=UPI000C9E783B|nr:divalent-cation tolerance protein CutA [Mangrovicella endophytica]
MAALDITVTCPDAASARLIARALIERRLAACCQIGAPVDSVFRWQGTVEEAREVPLTIKTREALFDHVAAAIRELHPYETPAITGHPAVADAPTLSWIEEACIASTDSSAPLTADLSKAPS